MRNRSFEDTAYRTKFGFRRKFIFVPFLVAGILALVSYIVMLLWNNLLPDILHTGTITYWQAMGIFILAKILFGFGRGSRGGAPWMQHKMERFRNMSAEDKERFRTEMRRRCGDKWEKHPWSRRWDEPATGEPETAKSAE